MISFVVFLFGLAVGSFLNAFIYRLEIADGLVIHPHGRKDLMFELLKGRSQCPSCGHTLAWFDLIPILSFILLKGRCRQCKEKISFQYPLVEFTTGILFILLLFVTHTVFPALASVSFLEIVELFYLWIIASLLIVIFVYDLKYFLIPDKILYPAIGLVLFWKLILYFQVIENLGEVNFLQVLFVGFGAASFFWAIHIFSKGRAMGFGDVKLAFFMGLFLGFPAIFVALAIAFSSGALIGLILIFSKRKTMRSEVPFGPFLIVGTFVAFYWGESLIRFYMNFLL